MTPWLPTSLYKISAAKFAALTLVAFASTLTLSSSYAQVETVLQGEALSLSASADGFPSPTFQWQKDGLPIPGATSVLHTLSAVTSFDAGVYSVLATNEAGSAVSSGLVINVEPIVSVGPVILPAFTTQPAASQTLPSGVTATFTVAVSGTPVPNCQWQKNGVPLAGMTGTTLTLANITTADSGSYTATAANTNGSVTSSAAILVVTNLAGPVAPPVITTQPNYVQTVATGGTATLTVTASGSPAPTYQWKKYVTDIVGATSSTLILTNVTTADSAAYAVVVTNSAGTTTSGLAIVSVTPAGAGNVAPTIGTQPGSQTASVGGTVTFTVAAAGTPSPTFQWRKNAVDIAGATGSSLVLTSLTSLNDGSYSVVALNVAGSVTSSAATLTVTTPPPAVVVPVITTQPASKTAVAGTAVTFTVAASGTPAPTFQWSKDGAQISGATTASFSLSSLTSANAGSYTVAAKNSAGSVTSSAATLTVTAAPVSNVAPVIITQPTSKTALAGATVTLTVAASGTPAPTFQWRKNGGNISGATNASLTFAVLTPANAGSYTVVVKNKGGSVTSSVATINVPLAPQITSQPLSQAVLEGNSVTFAVNPNMYQWFKDGVAIDGATTASYKIGTVLGVDAGSYTVVLTSEGGTVTSNPAALTVTGLTGK